MIDASRKLELKPIGLTFSPIKGPEGNIEYLLYLTNLGMDTVTTETIDEVVNQAHLGLAREQ
ncbi:hypothetical protein SDC9_64952 [bioreactor metagenome]|uniref:Uncharacterized protein n=1 Tax=bioreactor metagenome TaxID=1076179 RepID=A0A644XQM6_9ZZZZ